jgi:hypothetical protein
VESQARSLRSARVEKSIDLDPLRNGIDIRDLS